MEVIRASAFRRRALLVSVCAACGGGSEAPTNIDSGTQPTFDAPPGAKAVLKRPSKSATIAITDDDKVVAMVDPEDGSLSVFRTSDNQRVARVFACALRNLATAAATNTFGPAALEKKPDGSVAQGQGGCTMPALYGVALGAPYVHDGQALTLQDLLDRFPGHLKAGNDNFAATAEQKDALIELLLSIDATTPEVSVPVGFDKCVDFP